MPEIKSDSNVVETLRQKTEEADISQYLKSTIGGYTKSSVHEYLNLLRRQQQTMAETFSNNQQALFNEKERLKEDNEAIRERLSHSEQKYRSLSEALRCNDLSDSDVTELKNHITVLEEDLTENELKISGLEQQIEHQIQTIDELNLKAEQAEQENLSLKEMLKCEMTEIKNLRKEIVHLNASADGQKSEIKFLKSLMNEGQIPELKDTVSRLSHQLQAQTALFEICNNDKNLGLKTIETLTLENDAIRKNIDRISTTVEDLQVKNEKLSCTNSVLSKKLNEEYKRSIDLINEKSDIFIDKLTAERKLDDAYSKIALLELQLQNYKNSLITESIAEESESIFGKCNTQQ